MKNSIPSGIIFFLLSVFFVQSCSDKKEILDVPPLSDYMPLAVGKYITYRIDSLVFPNFGTEKATHSYQVKHEVNEELTDNDGNPMFRIYRFLNNAEGTGNWSPRGSYTITVKPDQIEVTEDNLRFIKLHAPIKDGFSWYGNSYLPDRPYQNLGFDLSEALTTFWEYYYFPITSSETIEGQTYTDVLTVEENDESANLPVTYGQAGSAFKTRSFAKYSKGIGLVYRHTELWEYQEGSVDNPEPYFVGFGITMWMIDHN